MFIDANRILELIDVCKQCVERLPENEQFIHVTDIAGTLQKLIDDEAEHLDKMAEEFRQNDAVDETETFDDVEELLDIDGLEG